LRVRAIPTYRVYQLYDNRSVTDVGQKWDEMFTLLVTELTVHAHPDYLWDKVKAFCHLYSSLWFAAT